MARGRRVNGEPGTGWRSATGAQADAWINRVASKCARPIGQCGQFKSRPSVQCQHCGYDPLPVGSDPFTFDREYGFTL